MYICIHIQSIQKSLTYVVMYLYMSSLLVLTQDLIYQQRKLPSSVDLYCIGPASQRNKFMQLIYMKIPPKDLRALNVQDA